RNDVGRTAGRKRNQQPYRPRWKIGGGLGRGKRGDAGREQESRNRFHDGHLRFAERRTLAAALGWAKSVDVEMMCASLPALWAAADPRKKVRPGNAPGRGADNRNGDHNL